MQIETVELKNIGPHRELTVELASSIVGIVGANGAGKSSFVNAIYAAFTGDFKRFNAATKAEVINNQAAKHEKAWIKIVGNHGGKPFELVLRFLVSRVLRMLLRKSCWSRRLIRWLLIIRISLMRRMRVCLMNRL